MDKLTGAIRYSLRQFWYSRVFTAAAVLTLALGIGGTTAIFTLIHAVMLRSLPVADPSRALPHRRRRRLLRRRRSAEPVGLVLVPAVRAAEGGSAGIRGGHRVPGGGADGSASDAQGATRRARPLRTEFVTGSYFPTLGVGAFGGRVLTPDDDAPSAPPAAVLSHHAWQNDVRRRRFDRRIDLRRRRSSRSPSSGSRRPGFSARRSKATRPTSGFRSSRNRSSHGESALLHQPVSAWLRVIGRLRPGASIDGMAPRLTGVLRQWMQYDSGYPSNWMPDVIRDAAEADHRRRSGGRRHRRDEGRVRPQPADPAWRSADSCCSSPAPTSRTSCSRERSRGAARRRSASPLARRGGRSSRRRSSRACCSRSRAASPGSSSPWALRGCCSRSPSRTRAFPADQHAARRSPVLAFAFGAGARHRHRVRRRAGVVCDAHRSGRRAARRRPQHQRPLVARAQGAARRPGDAVGGARRRRDDARAQPEQTRSIRTSVTRCTGASSCREPAAGRLHGAASWRRSTASSKTVSTGFPAFSGAGLALYNPLTDNWGELVLVAGPSRAED